MNDVVKTGNMPATQSDQDKPLNMLAIIADAVQNPAIDTGKMKELLDMQERLEERQARREFIEAENALQDELPSIGKKGEIKNNSGAVQSRYSKWEDIHRVITPLLRRNGFSLSFNIDTQNGMTCVEAVLSHVGGHVKTSGFMRLPTDKSGNKNDVQGVGSALSYGKRYTTIAILNLNTEGEDDDGQTASNQAAALITLKDEAKKAASCGMSAYERWFKEDIDKEQRRQLVDSGTHETMKGEAAKADAGDDFPGDRP